MKDHRLIRNKFHLIEDIVFITIMAVINKAASLE